MPTLEISEEQLEALEGVRGVLEETHVGRYGHVRRNDAFQFLLDRYATAHEGLLVELIQDRLAAQSYQELQRLAGMLEGVEPRGTEPELRRDVTVALLEEVLDVDGAVELLEASERVRAADRTGYELQENTSDEDDATARADPTDDEETQASDSSSNDAPADDGPSRLQHMMGLLETYTDRWSESESEDGKYAVELPDGSTEVVRTKDDVRAVLFKEYE